MKFIQLEGKSPEFVAKNYFINIDKITAMLVEDNRVLLFVDGVKQPFIITTPFNEIIRGIDRLLIGKIDIEP